MKIICTIEARMKSQRLPGKVLKYIGEYKSLELQIYRLKNSKLIDEIVIATTTDESDDKIYDLGKSLNIKVYRGSELDVMDRLIQACQFVGGDIIVQTTGDCPLIDPGLVDQVVLNYVENRKFFNLVGNNLKKSFPIGFDCRVFSLRKAYKLCKSEIHRVHGSTYIYSEDGKKYFKSKNIFADKHFNYPKLRLVLDTNEDFIFLNKVHKSISEDIININAKSLIKFLINNQKILNINKDVRQKEIHEG